MDELQTVPVDRSDMQRCCICGEWPPPVAFFKVTVHQCVFDQRAIQQQAGLELMLGGNTAIAAALSPTTKVADQIIPGVELYLCQECALSEDVNIGQLWSGEPAQEEKERV